MGDRRGGRWRRGRDGRSLVPTLTIAETAWAPSSLPGLSPRDTPGGESILLFRLRAADPTAFQAHLRALTGQIFQTTYRAAVPALVCGRGLESASSALGFGMNGTESLGPPVALLPVIGCTEWVKARVPGGVPDRLLRRTR